MEQTKIYDKAFQLFVSNDNDFRPEMTHPFKQRGNYYATDAHSLMLLPESEASLDYPEQLKPVADAVVPQEEQMRIEISISDLEAGIIPEIIDEEIEKTKFDNCDACEGQGEVEWEFDYKHTTHNMDAECPVCDGKGKAETITKEKTGRTIQNPHAYYKLGEAVFQYVQLKRLIDACKILNIETIIQTFRAERKPNLFTVGKAKILVMPTIVSDTAIVHSIILKALEKKENEKVD